MSFPSNNESWADDAEKDSRDRSRLLAPLGIAAGLAMVGLGIVLITWNSPGGPPVMLFFGIATTCAGLHFLIGYATWAYYRLRQPAIARAQLAGPPADFPAADIDDYEVPFSSRLLRPAVPGFLSTGHHPVPPLARAMRVVGVVNLVVVFASVITALAVGGD